jgi:hypothetical protein
MKRREHLAGRELVGARENASLRQTQTRPRLPAVSFFSAIPLN